MGALLFFEWFDTIWKLSRTKMDTYGLLLQLKRQLPTDFFTFLHEYWNTALIMNEYRSSNALVTFYQQLVYLFIYFYFLVETLTT